MGVVDGFEIDLFKDFNKLKVINLAISNLKEFFHLGNQWMKILNSKIKKGDLNRFLLRHLKQIVSFDSIYEYPNEDLCFFKDFPHDHSVFPLICPGQGLECSCTLYWLQSRLHLIEINIVADYNLNFQDTSIQTFLFCDEETFNLTECNLDKRFELCQYKKTNDVVSHKLSFNNDFDILYMIKMGEFIFVVILTPIFCFLGIVHNSLTILVIRNKSMKKDFKESMYKHIIINAMFNIVYCFLITLKLINTCIFHGRSVFCSNVYQEIWAQNLKIILIHFLANSIKLCSNFSYIIFSLSRLLLITKQSERNLNQNSKCKSFHYFIYVFVLILSSFILSLFKLFQYKLNNEIDVNKEFPFEFRDEFYCFFIVNNQFQCQLFNAFKIVYRSINDFLFVIFNIFIDLIVLVKFKRLMDKKLRQINDLAQRNLIEKSKKSLNRMILFNSFINMLSHLPSFTVTLLLVIYSKTISNICSNKFSCDLLNEEVDFFCLISIVGQFYVFKLFDKHFKRNINELRVIIYSSIFGRK